MMPHVEINLPFNRKCHARRKKSREKDGIYSSNRISGMIIDKRAKEIYNIGIKLRS